MKFFGGAKPDHPMAEVKEARKILDEISPNDPFKALDELSHWFESVRAVEGFKPEYRAQLVQMIDEAAQPHVRKLSRDYLSSSRLSKFQEIRLWGGIHEFWRQAALAYGGCIDLHVDGAKGADVLKSQLPLFAVRALRALSTQIKWQYLRYGPVDISLWNRVAKFYALAESRKFAQTRVAVYPNVPGESSPEQEFLKPVMLAASSPDSLLPVEVEIAERLIAHCSAWFKLSPDQQPDTAYWIDLASGHPPLRLARAPQRAPTLRFFAAGKADLELQTLIRDIKSSGAVPSGVSLGGTYEASQVLGVLDHLALYWSPKPPERKHPRHQVKSRLAVSHGLDGVFAVLDRSPVLEFDESQIESWIVDNVSSGGFGAVIPQIRGDWLALGALLAMQPEGGSNWVIGMIRRLNRESPQQATVGIQTLARQALVVTVREEGVEAGGRGDTRPGIVLEPASLGIASEIDMLLRPGTFVAGQNLEFEHAERMFLLLPLAPIEQMMDYERVRFRQMVRDTSE